MALLTKLFQKIANCPNAGISLEYLFIKAIIDMQFSGNHKQISSIGTDNKNAGNKRLTTIPVGETGDNFWISWVKIAEKSL